MPGKAKTARKAKARPRHSRAKNRAKNADGIDALITAGAQALKLPIDRAWHAAIRFNLQMILAHSARIDEFLLADDTEPAPVFRA